jgi:hypothetical protein
MSDTIVLAAVGLCLILGGHFVRKRRRQGPAQGLASSERSKLISSMAASPVRESTTYRVAGAWNPSFGSSVAEFGSPAGIGTERNQEVTQG